MKIRAQVSIYPLKTKSLSAPIDEFCRILEGNGLEVKVQKMDSAVTGESEKVFASLKQAFEKLAEKYNIVMDFKVSNTCPEETRKRNSRKEQNE